MLPTLTLFTSAVCPSLSQLTFHILVVFSETTQWVGHLEPNFARMMFERFSYKNHIFVLIRGQHDRNERISVLIARNLRNFHKKILVTSWSNIEKMVEISNSYFWWIEIYKFYLSETTVPIGTNLCRYELCKAQKHDYHETLVGIFIGGGCLLFFFFFLLSITGSQDLFSTFVLLSSTLNFGRQGLVLE